ncbi:hypothetical protein KY285_005651 [Solanum tuberosum]|nr:hypothetical protein KY285_005651 [Solanum tuberosum]
MLLHYNSPASWRLYITSITQPDTGFYITTAPPVGGFTLQALHSRIQAFYITTAPPAGGLHYKLYTAGYKLLRYNKPRQSRVSTTQVTLPASHSQYKTRHQQSTKHYNEELLLSSKLGQVSAMSSITSYVKDSLSKPNSTRFSEVQI